MIIYSGEHMITDRDKKIILKVAAKYSASRIWLFGSALAMTGESRDIDIAVEGIADKDFFAFYYELLCALSKPVDIVDLARKTGFNELVLKEGVALYG